MPRCKDSAVKIREGGQAPLRLSALRDDLFFVLQMLCVYRAETNTRNYEEQDPAVVSVDAAQAY